MACALYETADNVLNSLRSDRSPRTEDYPPQPPKSDKSDPYRPTGATSATTNVANSDAAMHDESTDDTATVSPRSPADVFNTEIELSTAAACLRPPADGYPDPTLDKVPDADMRDESADDTLPSHPTDTDKTESPATPHSSTDGFLNHEQPTAEPMAHAQVFSSHSYSILGEGNIVCAPIRFFLVS